MIKFPFTSRPWAIERSARSGVQVTTEGRDYRIACPGSGGAMSYTDTICTLSWSGTPEHEANALLIYAAPDLLVAALGLLTRTDFWQRPGMAVPAEYDDLVDAVNKALGTSMKFPTSAPPQSEES